MNRTRGEQERPARREVELPPGGWLALLVALFLLTAAAWWALVPYGQGPDEASHELFARTLAGQTPSPGGWAWGLPVFAPADRGLNFETHQPPLYYLLAAGLLRLGGLSAVRLLSLLCGALLVQVTWRLAREVYDEGLALGAAAVVALLPMNAFLATRVNNDPLVNLLWAVILWRWIVTLRDGPSRREGLWLGLLVGAALLTKQNSLGLLPLALLVFVLQGIGTKRWEAAGEQAALTLLVAGSLAGWWYLRNQVLYGDFLAQRVFDERFLTTRITKQALIAQFAQRPQWRYWPYVLEWTAQSYVIYLGQGLLRLPTFVYPVQVAIFEVALLGALVATVRRARRGWDATLAATVLLAAAMALVFVLLLKFNTVYFQAQGRYLFLTLPGWGLLLAGGPSRLFGPGSPARRYGLALAPLWLALMTLLLLGVFVPGLFA